jgi:hypothetical protein
VTAGRDRRQEVAVPYTVRVDYFRFSLQDGTEGVILPFTNHCHPGDKCSVDYKREGKVVRTDMFVCTAYREDGEVSHRWVKQGTA